MPRLTQEQSRERRAGILRAAERVFARYGYDGATVVRLEEETGLSRGAIFYYFADKTELFVAVAHDLNSRFVGLIIEQGVDDAVRSMAEQDSDLLWVILEVQSRLRHDKELERRLEERTPDRDRLLDWFAGQQAEGRLRNDVDAADLARYVTIVLNGIALQIAVGDHPDVPTTLNLLRNGLTPDAPSSGLARGTRPAEPRS
jgi:TetR/AcrR family transcriptional regulator, transcriptional repressor of aconitase